MCHTVWHTCVIPSEFCTIFDSLKNEQIPKTQGF
nr:MAG TPA: hypothetical protein [Caudoviricetes sp.]DAI80097.1 MAG TPA: hypothetical protein [Caudoviricetes sp.]